MRNGSGTTVLWQKLPLSRPSPKNLLPSMETLILPSPQNAKSVLCEIPPLWQHTLLSSKNIVSTSNGMMTHFATNSTSDCMTRLRTTWLLSNVQAISQLRLSFVSALMLISMPDGKKRMQHPVLLVPCGQRTARLGTIPHLLSQVRDFLSKSLRVRQIQPHT